MPGRIVIIEDEPDVIELVRYNFGKEGFEVAGFSTGREAIHHLRRHPADLLLLDIMLPGEDGLEICRQLRADDRFRALPVIFLTAKGAEIDRVLGLEFGADDYVVKPFSPRELVARARAVLRRQTRAEQGREVLEYPGLRLDARTHEVTVRDQPVELSSLEFRLVFFLASHPRQIFSRDHLLDEIWAADRSVTPRTIDVHIRRIREKIDAAFIQTVRGVGYRFSPLPDDSGIVEE